MNFSCDQCQKAYSIADEKVAGRAFKVTCRQCGHVIQVKASGSPPAAPPRAANPPAAPPRVAPPRVAPPPPAPPPAPPPPAPRPPAPPPAPRLAPLPPAPVLPADPADEQPPAPILPPLEHQTLETTDQHALFFAAQPTHRPRVTAEWMLQNRRKHPALFFVVAAAGVLVVAGGIALSIWQVQRPRTGPAEASERSRQQQAPAPAPQRVVMPAESVQGAPPAPPPSPVELQPEPPLAQRGAVAPRGVGGRAGFEAVGSGGGGADVREKLRRRNLTIAKKDRRLLDLLDKKADSAPTRPGTAERTELDTGGATLDEAAVRQTMAASGSAYSACVTRALKDNPNLRVDGKRATLMLTIKSSGVVQSAWIAEAELDKSALGKCLVSTARRMVFPAFSGDPIDVSVPLALSTQL